MKIAVVLYREYELKCEKEELMEKLSDEFGIDSVEEIVDMEVLDLIDDNAGITTTWVKPFTARIVEE